MNLYSSDKTKYNSSYWQWLKVYTKDFFLVFVDLIKDWSVSCLSMLCWMVLFITSPISLPLIVLFIRISSRRKLVKRYGLEILREERR